MFSKAPRKGLFSPPPDTPGPSTNAPSGAQQQQEPVKGAVFDSVARLEPPHGKQIDPDSAQRQPKHRSAKPQPLARSVKENAQALRTVKGTAKGPAVAAKVNRGRMQPPHGARTDADHEAGPSAEVPDLAVKLAELVALHDSAKERYAAGVSVLRYELAAMTQRAVSAEQRRADVETRSAVEAERELAEAKGLALKLADTREDTDGLRAHFSEQASARDGAEGRTDKLKLELDYAHCRIIAAEEAAGDEHAGVPDHVALLEQRLAIHDDEPDVFTARTSENMSIITRVALAAVAEARSAAAAARATSLENAGLQLRCAALQETQSALAAESSTGQSMHADMDALLRLRKDEAELFETLRRDLCDIDDERSAWQRERSSLACALELAHKEAGVLRLEAARLPVLIAELQARAARDSRSASDREDADRAIRTSRKEHYAAQTDAVASANELEAQRHKLATVSAELERLRQSSMRDRAELQEAQTKVAVIEGQLKAACAYARSTEAALAILKVTEERHASEKAELGGALKNAICYQDAYEALLTETEALMARNALAEDEAAALSEINAELMGHANAMQKVQHMGKVRRELTACKQQLVAAVLERDEAVRQQTFLAEQLSAFCSLDVPLNLQPAAKLTRVQRLPPMPSLSQPPAMSASMPRPAFNASRAIFLRPARRVSLPHNRQARSPHRSRYAKLREHAQHGRMPYRDADGAYIAGDEGAWRDEMDLQELGQSED